MPRRVTDKMRAANRANASKPRPLRGKKPSLETLQVAENVKDTIGKPALERCLRFWIGVLDRTEKREIVTEAGIIKADPSLEQRMAASREIADRCGMPRLTQVDAGKAAFPIVVVGADWPGLASE